MLFFLILIIILVVVGSSILKKRRDQNFELERIKISRSRTCPMCAEEVKPEAKICRHCSNELPVLDESEKIEIEANYQKRLESLDPIQQDKKERMEKAKIKAKNAKDWENA